MRWSGYVKQQERIRSCGSRRFSTTSTPALEDKIVQRAAVEVLNAIYETDFLGFSYGFRPERSQHGALDALYTGLLTRKVNWMFDLDIRNFFDGLSHEWLVKFIQHRVADRRGAASSEMAACWRAGGWETNTCSFQRGLYNSDLLCGRRHKNWIMSASMHSSKADNTAISDRFLNKLENYLGHRRIGKGIRLLEANKALIDSFGPGQRNGGVFLGQICQWLYIGFAEESLITKVMKRFPVSCRGRLPLNDYVHLRLADGYQAQLLGKHEEAIRHFETVLTIEDDIQQENLKCIANFWIASALRALGRYRDALAYIAKARDAALDANYGETTALVQELEGWVLFEEGNSTEAEKLLGEAEAVLLKTDDHTTRGYVYFVRGRIARRRGQYHQALQYFNRATEETKEYERRSRYERHLPRTLTNIALVKRLLALRTQMALDRRALESRTSDAVNRGTSQFQEQADRRELGLLRKEAFEHLAKARKICIQRNDSSGEGNIYATTGYLHLDHGDYDLASYSAEAAYRLGDGRRDNTLRARARILQSTIERTKCEEVVGEGQASADRAQLAEEFARDAIRNSNRTQNQRLLAHATTTLGLVLCMEPHNMEEARRCSERVEALLDPDDRDYVWADLQMLKNQLLSTGTVDLALRAWSQGDVEGKTFAQIRKEFEAIVIPSVWRREGQKVSRAATRLSISPKKVRRILQRDATFQPKKREET